MTRLNKSILGLAGGGILLLVLLSLVFAGGADQTDTRLDADAPKLVVLYDLGGKFDKSFNESAYNGAQQFFTETGLRYTDFEPTLETQYEQALRRYARLDYDAIVAVGLAYAVAVRNVAAEFPEIQFTVVDAFVDLPNVRTVSFKEHEGSFLAGIAAGLQSKTGSIGFIGGMEIPLIKRFRAGYLEGAQFAVGEIDIATSFVGSTPSAWNDPIKAADLARGQFSRGVDVIYHAAGPSGLGVIQAAKDTGNFAIGVDSNQNPVAPGRVLTSMVKRVDRAVYEAFKDTVEGRWSGGVQVLGLKENGVDIAIDEHNEALISARMRALVAEARAKIIAGEIVVADIEGANDS